MIFAVSAAGQRIAVAVPSRERFETAAAAKLLEGLSKDLKVVDIDIANAAVTGIGPEDIFNLHIDDARRLGAAIGTDFFILLRADVIRRSSSARPVYFEGYCSAFLVNSRSGKLINWRLIKFEEDTAEQAEAEVFRSMPGLAEALLPLIRSAFSSEIMGSDRPRFDEVPEEDSPEAKGLRPPIPYRRIRPEYTTEAYFHNIRATVDIEVDIDADGQIVNIDMVRWAGYGLDESVETAVRTMNWRPAERNGKTLPMRVLLRYNFTKVEKDGSQ